MADPFSSTDEYRGVRSPLTQTGYGSPSRRAPAVDPPKGIGHDGPADGAHGGTQSLTPDGLRRLITKLRREKGLEEVATVLTSEMLRICNDAIEHSRYRRNSRMLRAVVHLRPEGGYRGLVMIDAKTLLPAALGDDPAFLSSATAWEHVRSLKETLFIDVQLGAATPASPGPDAPKFNGRRTLELMKRRSTTHLMVVPLVGVDGNIHGLISLEAECRSAVGQPFIWPDCVQEIDTIAAVGTPWLLGLPAERPSSPEFHETLPVVGATMHQLIGPLRVFARQPETLLLLGPTGTGKSRLARWCHAISPRAEQPLEVVDITAIPENLRAGELFGWTKGAFTGAGKDRDGAVARAEGGTLFIDEIDKLDLPTQAALLRLLEDHQYEVLGDNKGARSADVRFIVGTNADLGAAIEAGRFLPDLYYRINVLPVRLPPLVERQDEIEPWARYMLDRRVQEGRGQDPAVLTSEACDILQRYPWPGNLRQLDNIVRRAYALSLVGLTDRTRKCGVHDVGAEHVEKALAQELWKARSIRRGDVVAALQRAAAEAIAAARSLRISDTSLDLDLLVGSLRALLFQEAVASESSPAEAFALLGRARLVEKRNDKRAMNRANEQLDKLRALLDELD